MGSRVRQEQTKSGAWSLRQPASPGQDGWGLQLWRHEEDLSLGTSNTQGDGSSGPALSGSWVPEEEEGDYVLIADWRQLDPNQDSPVLPAGT